MCVQWTTARGVRTRDAPRPASSEAGDMIVASPSSLANCNRKRSGREDKPLTRRIILGCSCRDIFQSA